jgi:hypothetical protein
VAAAGVRRIEALRDGVRVSAAHDGLVIELWKTCGVIDDPDPGWNPA